MCIRDRCDCANGLRTIGCCSHIASIIYYFSRARYLAKIVRPAEILNNVFTSEDIGPVIEEDSDSDGVRDYAFYAKYWSSAYGARA